MKKLVPILQAHVTLIFPFILAIMLVGVGYGDDGNFDFVIVVDISGSMSYNQLIGPVQDTFEDMIETLFREGDTVSIITFGTAVSTSLPTEVFDPGQSESMLLGYISSLSFNEDHTYHALAISSAFDKCRALESEYPDHQKIILFLTDGENDPPPGLPDEIHLDEVRNDESSYNTDWYVVHVQMAEDQAVNPEESSIEIVPILLEMFGAHYLYSSDLSELVSILEQTMDKFVTLQYPSSDELDLYLEEVGQTYSGYIDIVICGAGPGEEVPIEVLDYSLSCPALPSGIEISDSSEVVNGRLRVFINARLAEPVMQDRYQFSVIPSLASDGENWRFVSPPDDAKVTLHITVLEPIVMEFEPDKLNLVIPASGEEISCTTVIKELLPLGLEENSVVIEYDAGDLPDAIEYSLLKEFPVEGKLEITLSVQASLELENADYPGSIVVRLSEDCGYASDPVEIPVTIATRMVPPTWPRTLGITALIAAVLFTGFILLKRYNEKKLFGVLKFASNEAPANRKRFDLSKEGLSCTLGGKGSRITELRTELATLDVAKEGKYRFVRVTPVSGVELAFNGRREPHLLLHNHDRFTLAEWNFEYSGRTIRRSTRNR